MSNKAGEMEPVSLPVHTAVEEATKGGASWEDNAALTALSQQVSVMVVVWMWGRGVC